MCITTYGQKDSVNLIKVIDKMSDQTHIIVSRYMIVANNTKTTGFKLKPFINENYSINTIYVKMVNIGGCNKNDEIIILFENNEKIKIKSWNKFNCDGEAYFNLTKSDVILLKSQPILKIRMMNGYTYDSFTGDLDNDDKNYFIDIFQLVDAKLIKETISE